MLEKLKKNLSFGTNSTCQHQWADEYFGVGSSLWLYMHSMKT